MKSSYKENDVILLFKDISNMVIPEANEEREKKIQSGRHYSEMLPIEYEPTSDYLDIYKLALKKHSKKTAMAVANVAEKIYEVKNRPVLVSLARAGTSTGILIKHYLERKYHINVPHYSISIIRDRGIDKNAMAYIIAREEASSIQFVDGWTGKGVIQRELKAALKEYEGVSDKVAVLADPASITDLCGTHDDFLIASSCLNATISGLISRTFLRSDIIGENDFHGVMVYDNLAGVDHTYEFIDCVESYFDFNIKPQEEEKKDAKAEVEKICEEFDITDINLVKPSIGETTRVLLRRIPWKVLVYSLDDQENLGHIYQLAKEKNVEVMLYPLKCYKAVGIIKKLGDN